MELTISPVFEPGKVEERRDDGAGDRENRVEVPRAPPESFPGKSDNAYNDISYIHNGKGQEYVIYHGQSMFSRTHEAYLSHTSQMLPPQGLGVKLRDQQDKVEEKDYSKQPLPPSMFVDSDSVAPAFKA